MQQHPPPTGSLITGDLIILTFAIFFLLRALKIIDPQNWWAIFILVPTFSSIGNLWDDTIQKKPFSFSQLSALSGILFPILITILLLWNLNWIKFFPTFILIAGYLLFQTAFLRISKTPGTPANFLSGWFLAGGLSVLMIGILLFFFNPLTTPPATIPLRWRGVALLLFASGSLLQREVNKKRKKQSKIVRVLNFLASFWLAIPGVLALSNLQLNFPSTILVLASGSLVIIWAVQKSI